jgi:hypothetical protein
MPSSAVERARDERDSRKIVERIHSLQPQVAKERAVMGRSSHEAAAVVRVRVPSPLRSYTGSAEVAVAVPVLAPELPPTLGGVLAALDGAYPGIRFRMIDEQGHVRPHIKLFIDTALTRDLATPLPGGSSVLIVAALSGG